MQRIARTDNERDWPFSVDEGNLTCVWSIGQKLVFFFEDAAAGRSTQDDAFEARGVMVIGQSVRPDDRQHRQPRAVRAGGRCRRI